MRRSLELSTHIVGIVGDVGYSRSSISSSTKSFIVSYSLLNILLSAFYYSSKGLRHKSCYIIKLKSNLLINKRAQIIVALILTIRTYVLLTY
jgi:hypothetical protein